MTRRTRDKGLIVGPRRLWRAVNECGRHRVIGIDTESNSFWAYRERVCVIQLIAGERIFLIDPLALEDLSPLGQVFHDPGIVKVFHGADYDLRCLYRDFALRAVPIFDTMVAASLLAYPAVGLGALVQHHFGVDLPKTNALTRYNWATRPLPEQHLDYLQNDVRYLLPLREALLKELEAKELMAEAEWEFRQLEQITRRATPAVSEGFFAIKGARQLEPLQQAVMKQVYEYRERMAEKHDVPRFKVFSDSIVLTVARELPHRTEALAKIPGISPRLVRRHARHLLEAVRAGQEDFRQGRIPAPPTHRAVRGPHRNSERELRLKQWRAAEAQRRGVSPQAVLPTACLKDLARSSHVDDLALSQMPGMIPSRMQRYAKRILELVSS